MQSFQENCYSLRLDGWDRGPGGKREAYGQSRFWPNEGKVGNVKTWLQIHTDENLGYYCT